MIRTVPLSPERLRRPADLSQLPFSTTVDIAPVDGLIGQQRALDAVSMATRMEKSGYNLVVVGPSSFG